MTFHTHERLELDSSVAVMVTSVDLSNGMGDPGAGSCVTLEIVKSLKCFVELDALGSEA